VKGLAACVLGAAMLLGAPSAQALAPKTCDALNYLVTQVMDARLAGTPIQTVLRRQDIRPDFLPVWARVVASVYTLPRASLYGPGRADFLSALYFKCLAVKPQ